MFKIKPCPKCGGQPVYHKVGLYRKVGVYAEYYILQCESCGYIAAKLKDASLTKLGARLVWNREAVEWS